MIFSSTYRKLLSLGMLAVVTLGWTACSSTETKEAYDKFYGKGRADRDAQGVVEDSLRRLQLKELSKTQAAEVETAAPAKLLVPPKEIAELLDKNTCSVCHKADERLVGPAWKDVAKRNYPIQEIVSLVREPKPEHWPDYPPMAPLGFVPEEDIIKIGTWINSLQ